MKMVDVSYQMMLSTLQTVGLLVGIVYYVMTLRNQQRTQQLSLESRKIQIQRDYLSRTASREILKDFITVLYQEWEDFPDFLDKYGPQTNMDAYFALNNVLEQLHILGQDMSYGVIDAEYVYDRGGESYLRLLNKVMPLVNGMRNRSSIELQLEFKKYLEYLTSELTKVRLQKHPELGIT